jgi:hypothetical protein
VLTVLPPPTLISVFIPSPSTPTRNHPSFSLSITYYFTHLASLPFSRPMEIRHKLHLSTYLASLPLFKPLEIRHKLHLPTYLIYFFLVFSRLQSIYGLFLLLSSTVHRVFCNFWQGVSFQFFRFRFTLFQKQLQDTHLTNVSGFHRRSSFTPPASAPPRLAHMLQRALCSLRHVGAMFVLPSFHLDRLQCFWASPANPAAERPPLGGAWTSRAITDGSHSSSINRTFAVFTVFLFVCLFYWVYLLYPSPPVYPCFGPCDSIHL